MRQTYCLPASVTPSVQRFSHALKGWMPLTGLLACPKRPEPDVPALAVFWSPAGDNRALHPPLLCVGDVAVCAAEPARLMVHSCHRSAPSAVTRLPFLVVTLVLTASWLSSSDL